MREIEFFEDVEPREPPRPEGPAMTLNKGKSTAYFNGAASDIIRDWQATHIRFGIDYDALKGVVAFCNKDDRGALVLSGGNKRKGPGTYQAGGAMAFFQRYAKPILHRRIFELTVDQDLPGFIFDFEEVKKSRRKR